MKVIDKSRKWMWLFLAALGAFQLYFVKELLAAFALFALGFAFIAAIIAVMYALQKGWEAGLSRVARSSNPAVLAAKRGVSAVEDLARRPLRRPGSAAHAR
jgi:hypothetical protein